MRAVIQRVDKASATVKSEVTGSIGAGLLLFLGVEADDTLEDLEWLAAKIPALRVFEDEEGRMNRSLTDTDGDILAISQFTLFGNVRKGTRPSFNKSAPPEKAREYYEKFVESLSRHLAKPVPTGVFGAHMQIKALNNGPVTLFIDTRNKKL